MPIRFVPNGPAVDYHAILQDHKIEAVLDRCYREWAAQRRGLIVRFLPQLHRFLFKQKMDWQKMFGITKDLYLPLEAPRRGFHPPDPDLTYRNFCLSSSLRS